MTVPMIVPVRVVTPVIMRSVLVAAGMRMVVILAAGSAMIVTGRVRSHAGHYSCLPSQI